MGARSLFRGQGFSLMVVNSLRVQGNPLPFLSRAYSLAYEILDAPVLDRPAPPESKLRSCLPPPLAARVSPSTFRQLSPPFLPTSDSTLALSSLQRHATLGRKLTADAIRFERT